MSAVEVLSSEVDSMNMRGRGNGECKYLLVVVWLFLALGWIGTGAVAAQEARSKAEVLPADTAKVSPGGATFTVPAGWAVETGERLGGVDAVTRYWSPPASGPPPGVVCAQRLYSYRKATMGSTRVARRAGR